MVRCARFKYGRSGFKPGSSHTVFLLVIYFFIYIRS